MLDAPGVAWDTNGVESPLLPLPHFNPELRGLHDRRAEARDLAGDCDLDGAKLQPLLEEDDRQGKPNRGTEFWAEIYTKNSIERAAHILDLIDEKWPTVKEQACSISISRDSG